MGTHRDGLVFETSRARVFHIREGDAGAMFRVYGVAGQLPFVDGGDPLDYPTCERWVRKTLDNVLRYGYGMCIVLERESSELIGLVHSDGQDLPEIKYALLPGFHGRGLATELAREMIEHGRHRFGMRQIIGTVDPMNAASIRVLEKCGMTPGEPRTEEDGSTTLVYAIELGERDQRSSTDQ